MMEMMAPGRKARSRYFRLEDAMRGIGMLVIEPQDFPRIERDRLLNQVAAAFEAGTLHGEALDVARQVGNALRAPCSMLEALRWFLGADGRELVSKVRTVAATVPALGALADWIM